MVTGACGGEASFFFKVEVLTRIYFSIRGNILPIPMYSTVLKVLKSCEPPKIKERVTYFQHGIAHINVPFPMVGTREYQGMIRPKVRPKPSKASVKCCCCMFNIWGMW
jgi:hypothetical protein